MKATILSEEVIVLRHKVCDGNIDNKVDHFSKNLEVTKLIPKEREDALDDTNHKDKQVKHQLFFTKCQMNAVGPGAHT